LQQDFYRFEVDPYSRDRFAGPQEGILLMNHPRAPVVLALALSTFGIPQMAHAVTCANGVYRAGRAGPNGAAVVHNRPPPPRTVTCANGVYRAGCAGPNGAAVTKK
jgi:hypothetical protein